MKSSVAWAWISEFNFSKEVQHRERLLNELAFRSFQIDYLSSPIQPEWSILHFEMYTHIIKFVKPLSLGFWRCNRPIAIDPSYSFSWKIQNRWCSWQTLLDFYMQFLGIHSLFVNLIPAPIHYFMRILCTFFPMLPYFHC